MPQFDFFSFYTQIFWTFLFICIFYLVYLKFPIKNLTELFNTRIQLIKAKKNFIGKEFEISEKFLFFYQNVISKRIIQKSILVKKI